MIFHARQHRIKICEPFLNNTVTLQLQFICVNSHNNFFRLRRRSKNYKSLYYLEKRNATLSRITKERERDCASSYCFKARKFAPLDASRLHASKGVRFSATLYSRDSVIFGCAWDFWFVARLVTKIDIDTHPNFPYINLNNYETHMMQNFYLKICFCGK